ncbi:MAG: hypothetical protein GY807_08505 [Gammaproteobacteria bacterium]|nr:hypothetical protein [Gammaproteobacteria bacterium]
MSNGNRRVISGASTGSGPALNGPIGIALNTANQRVLVANQFLTLLAVNLISGDRRVISNASMDRGAGPRLVGIKNIALDATNNRVLMTDNDQKALIVVDIPTGDRVLFSR